MKKVLIVVDMQNDFIDGSLGSADAQAIVPRVVEEILNNEYGYIFPTLDTHYPNYLISTLEGKYLPVEHCRINTDGHKFNTNIKNALDYVSKYNGVRCRAMIKTTFGFLDWHHDLMQDYLFVIEEEDIEFTIVGLCTDICVVSNALILRAQFPNSKIRVIANACAGTTPAKHEAALQVMESCQIDIVRN